MCFTVDIFEFKVHPNLAKMCSYEKLNFGPDGTSAVFECDIYGEHRDYQQLEFEVVYFSQAHDPTSSVFGFACTLLLILYYSSEIKHCYLSFVILL